MKKVKSNEAMMKEACDLASHSVKIGGGPFGCVITDKDLNIVGKGHNMVTINNDPTLHAEIVAIRDACSNLNTYILEDYQLYTSCEPCPMCLSAIYWSRIKVIYYGNNREDAKNIGFDDDYIYDEIPKNIDDRSIKMYMCNDSYAKDSFKKWSEKQDKKEY
jgi:tRNA(Arg) A34 adenosine deaminase TadA